MPILRGSSAGHEFETGGTFNEYRWTCSCGVSTEPVYPTLRAARDAIDRHLAEAA